MNRAQIIFLVFFGYILLSIIACFIIPIMGMLMFIVPIMILVVSLFIYFIISLFLWIYEELGD